MKRAVLICPGRGTYNKAELGYLSRNFPDRAVLAGFDAVRVATGQESLIALDGAGRFSMSRHGRGDNAAGLIYAAGYGDFLSIDQDAYDIVAVTGNSMGWYTALACGGALSATDGFLLANTMGTLMQQAMIGGQMIYPWVKDDWVPDHARREDLLRVVRQINACTGQVLSLSIDLGGMLVLAGNDAGLSAFEKAVDPAQGRFPMRLAHHAAFHSPLQAPVAQQGRAALADLAIGQPDLPLIDGRGAIWWPHSTDTQALWDYTLGHQITEPFDFTRAVTVAARDFAPDLFIIAGPGGTLGGAVAQSLICAQWHGLADKSQFKHQQATRPLLLPMGMDDQRAQVT